MAIPGKALKSAVYPGFRSSIFNLRFQDDFWGWNANRIPWLFIGEAGPPSGGACAPREAAPKPRLALQTTKRPIRRGNRERRPQAEISPTVSVALRTFASRNPTSPKTAPRRSKWSSDAEPNDPAYYTLGLSIARACRQLSQIALAVR